MSPETRTFRPTSKRSSCSLKPSYGVSSQPNSELAPSRTRVAFRPRASLASASTGDGAARARGDGPTHWHRSHLCAATCNGRVVAVSPPRAARISVGPRATAASPPCHRHVPRASLCGHVQPPHHRRVTATRRARVSVRLRATAASPPCNRRVTASPGVSRVAVVVCRRRSSSAGGLGHAT